MPSRSLLYLALLPLVPILVFLILPAQYREPYAYWSSDDLNRGSGGAGGGRVKTWRNMGYWKDTNDYSTAAEAMARELIKFAGVKPGGRVMDIGHGSGESLLLHLESSPPPSHLHALTSLTSESRQAQALVSAQIASDTAKGAQRTRVEFYVGSAVPKGASDTEHPLHPMKGFMGDVEASAGGAMLYDADDEDDKDDVDEHSDLSSTSPHSAPQQTTASASPAASAPPYDLIYVLDAAYHFPPSLLTFISTAYRHLVPGGVLAYTDVVPPPSLGSRPFLARILSLMLSVPMDNLIRVHKYDQEHDTNVRQQRYQDDLRSWGYSDCVEVQDWTPHVWAGFAANLQERGGMWGWVAKGVKWAEREGWGVMAVRIGKLDEEGSCPASFGSR